jgi:hypothetical protein
MPRIRPPRNGNAEIDGSGASPIDAAPAEPVPHATPSAAPAPIEIDPVKVALDATIRAEDISRGQSMVDRYIDGLNVSDRQKNFLRQNPLLLNPEIGAIARGHYVQALAQGMQDDTDELERHILNRTGETISHLRSLRTARPEPAVEKVNLYPSDAELDAEADKLIAEAAPEPPRKANGGETSLSHTPRVGYSAPVSRGAQSYSGRPSEIVGRTVTLSPEERDIARRSYSWMPGPDAEKLYAQMKMKRDRLRAAGQYE